MTFEVGQRVRVLPGARSNLEDDDVEHFTTVAGDKTGTITDSFFYGDLAVEDSDGVGWVFAPVYLVPLEDASTTATSDVKVGDRVRATAVFEGVVSYVFDSGNFEIGKYYINREIYSVEILESKPKIGDPFTVELDVPTGTTLLGGTNHYIFKTDEGWRDNCGYLYEFESSLEGSTTIVYLPEEAK